MARIPSVANGLLDMGALGGTAALAVGSPAWFAWLADDAARSFAFRSAEGSYTARKEHRGRRGGYWVAYRTLGGRQHKAYLGKAEELTPERLAQAALARLDAGLDNACCTRLSRPPSSRSPLANWRSCACWPPAPRTPRWRASWSWSRARSRRA
jgi:hypothetical protein